MKRATLHRGRLAAALVAGVLAASVASVALALEAIPPNRPTSAELVGRQNVTGDVTKGLFWNGKTITFHGEAIGERMIRGDYAWIHLNDDAYMERNVEEGQPLGGPNSGMAVWIPASMTRDVDTYGDYKHEGSIVEVTGIFNAACAQHGGDTDIHATSLTRMREGHPALDPIRPWKAGLAILLVASAGGLFWADRRRKALTG